MIEVFYNIGKPSENLYFVDKENSIFIGITQGSLSSKLPMYEKTYSEYFLNQTLYLKVTELAEFPKSIEEINTIFPEYAI